MAISNQQIFDKIEEFGDRMENIEHSIEQVQKTADENSYALRGDLSAQGLVSLVKANAEAITIMKTLLDRHDKLLIGDGQHIGIVEIIRAFDKERAVILKIVWFCVGTIVTAVTAYLVNTYLLV